MYGNFAIALPPAMMREITSGARIGVCARPPLDTLARTAAVLPDREPRLNCLTACSICLSSRRISASDGAPGEISEPWLDFFRRGAAGASSGEGARFAPRVPAGGGEVLFFSRARGRTTPPASPRVAAGPTLTLRLPPRAAFPGP